MNTDLRSLCVATVTAGGTTVGAALGVAVLLQQEVFREHGWSAGAGALAGLAADGLYNLRERWDPIVPWKEKISARSLGLALLAFVPFLSFWISFFLVFDSSPHPVVFGGSAVVAGVVLWLWRLTMNKRR